MQEDEDHKGIGRVAVQVAHHIAQPLVHDPYCGVIGLCGVYIVKQEQVHPADKSDGEHIDSCSAEVVEGIEGVEKILLKTLPAFRNNRCPLIVYAAMSLKNISLMRITASTDNTNRPTLTCVTKAQSMT